MDTRYINSFMLTLIFRIFGNYRLRVRKKIFKVVMEVILLFNVLSYLIIKVGGHMYVTYDYHKS